MDNAGQINIVETWPMYAKIDMTSRNAVNLIVYSIDWLVFA